MDHTVKRYILTGTPGAGKTTLLRLLAERGYATVPEAATWLIERELARNGRESWTHEEFIDRIVALQRRRQVRPAPPGATVQFFDRSPVCTHALCIHLGCKPSALLLAELDRITRGAVYQPQVLFLGNLGFCEPTAARRITFEQSLVFEQIHRDSYLAFGYELIDIPAAPAAERVQTVIEATGPRWPNRGAPGQPDRDRRSRPHHAPAIVMGDATNLAAP
jgi:predicted ATPase